MKFILVTLTTGEKQSIKTKHIDYVFKSSNGDTIISVRSDVFIGGSLIVTESVEEIHKQLNEKP